LVYLQKKNDMKKSYFILPILCFAIFFGCAPIYKTAQEKYELGQFNTAIPLFQESLNKSQHEREKGKINMYIGDSYRLSNRIAEALPFYEKALEEKYYTDALAFHYGKALKASGRYEDAAKQFSGFVKTGSDYALVKQAKDELEGLKVADSLAKGNPYMRVTNLAGVNTEAIDYAPVLWGDKMVFTSSRNASKIYEATGTGFTDLYMIDTAKLNDSEAGVMPFSDVVNSNGFHEATPAFAKEGKMMIFARSNSGAKGEKNILDVNLYISEMTENEWSEAKLLIDITQTKKSWDGTPTFSTDGQTLYFASDRDGGYGGLDLWSSKMNDRGEWSRPRNMGKDINSPANEMFPHVSAEGELFFASDGHQSLGGLDIFEAVRADGSITVRNLGAPINSSSDDFGMVTLSEKSGYFTSNRSNENSKGDDDIYHYIDETPAIKVVNYYLAGVTKENRDDVISILPDVKLTLNNLNGGMIDETVSDSKGNYRFPKMVELEENYTIFAVKNDEYKSHSDQFSTVGKEANSSELTGDTTDIVFNKELMLITKPKEIIILEKTGEASFLILYDLAKWDIRPDAAEELDKVVEYMRDNPTLHIELGSHTDSRGRAAYNMNLSKKRAASAVEYIVSKGIKKNKLVAKGYGETDLAVPNAKTNEEHQKNRRTTIKNLDKKKE
jgi:peptidoglycan-associated lipoprotein